MYPKAGSNPDHAVAGGARQPCIAKTSRPLGGLDAPAMVTHYRRGQEICSQGCRAESWFSVVEGAARRCAIRPDGRRQIVDLLLPGDFFGFTAADTYDFTVEAVAGGTVIASYVRRRVEQLADSDPQLARKIRQVSFEALCRLQDQLLIVGRITALEKVSSFILEMATRLSDGRGDRVVLPVSRYDIADYLAVSVETVSRALTDLKHRGVISFSDTRTVRIVNRDALEEGEDCHPAQFHMKPAHLRAMEKNRVAAPT